MKVTTLITLILIISLILLAMIFTIVYFKKKKQLAIQYFKKDLEIVNKKYKIKSYNLKELPINSEDVANEEIYFCSKVVKGQYNNNCEKISDENKYNIGKLNSKQHGEVFYQYYHITIGRQKFVPLNKIDLLISKKFIYLCHSLEQEEINLKDIKKITFFWEKNPLIKKREYFPGINFTINEKHYFLLFQSYNEALKFIACINNLCD